MKLSLQDIKRILKNFFKQINTPYELNIKNKDAQTEVLHVELTKKSVYIFLSTFLIFTFITFSLIILFTPLKYYLPGFGNDVNRKQLLEMTKEIKSLEAKNLSREKFVQNLILIADSNMILDTSMLNNNAINQANNINSGKIDNEDNYAYLREKYKDTVKDEKNSEIVEPIETDSTKKLK